VHLAKEVSGGNFKVKGKAKRRKDEKTDEHRTGKAHVKGTSGEKR
jgi:hypothetical protein